MSTAAVSGEKLIFFLRCQFLSALRESLIESLMNYEPVLKGAVVYLLGTNGKSFNKNGRDQVLWARETELCMPHKHLFLLKPLDPTTWLKSLLSKVFRTNLISSAHDLSVSVEREWCLHHVPTKSKRQGRIDRISDLGAVSLLTMWIWRRK